jgi:hypothetical protein
MAGSKREYKWKESHKKSNWLSDQAWAKELQTLTEVQRDLLANFFFLSRPCLRRASIVFALCWVTLGRPFKVSRVPEGVVCCRPWRRSAWLRGGAKLKDVLLVPRCSLDSGQVAMVESQWDEDGSRQIVVDSSRWMFSYRYDKLCAFCWVNNQGAPKKLRSISVTSSIFESRSVHKL